MRQFSYAGLPLKVNLLNAIMLDYNLTSDLIGACHMEKGTDKNMPIVITIYKS